MKFYIMNILLKNHLLASTTQNSLIKLKILQLNNTCNGDDMYFLGPVSEEDKAEWFTTVEMIEKDIHFRITSLLSERWEVYNGTHSYVSVLLYFHFVSIFVYLCS